MNRTQMKELAQDHIMDAVSVALGYWHEQLPARGVQIPEELHDEFRAIMQREADRVAKIFGYNQAWSS